MACKVLLILLTRLRCVSMAPLGRPVVPEVYKIAAMSSAGLKATTGTGRIGGIGPSASANSAHGMSGGIGRTSGNGSAAAAAVAAGAPMHTQNARSGTNG